MTSGVQDEVGHTQKKMLLSTNASARKLVRWKFELLEQDIAQDV